MRGAATFAAIGDPDSANDTAQALTVGTVGTQRAAWSDGGLTAVQPLGHRPAEEARRTRNDHRVRLAMGRFQTPELARKAKCSDLWAMA